MDTPNYNDIYDEIDNPKTMREKTKQISKYVVSAYPSSYSSCFCFWFLVPISIAVLCIVGGIAEQWIIPTPKPASIDTEMFSEERAFSYLDFMSLTIGYRTLGSRNNLETASWLLKELRNITKTYTKPEFRVEIITRPFDTIYAHGAENILVRVSKISNDPEGSSVLVSAHYDSAPFSNGGGDNAMNVASMMELLRNILSKKEAPMNPIIFLFNNGEEMGMLGVRAFMQNTTFWGKKVINLDSMGGPGKEILFRTNPSSIVSEYSVVPHPHANVIGEEIIKFIPSYTDFTVFMEYNVPGLDLALYSFGYNYHTLGDVPSTLTKGGIQHIGDNVLSLLILYGYNPINNLPNVRYIYFDVFGLFLVRIPEILMLIVQYILLILLFVTPILYVITEKLLFEYIWHKEENQIQKPDETPRPSKLSLVLESVGVFILYILGYILSFALAIGITALYGFLTSLVNPMSWFSSVTFSIFLYAFPALFGLILGQYITFKLSWLFCFKRITTNITVTYQKERFLSMFYIIIVPLAAITFFQIRSGYIFVISSIIYYLVVTTFLMIDSFNSFMILRINYHENEQPETYNLLEIEDNEIQQSQLERHKQNMWKPEQSKKGKNCLEFISLHIWTLVPFFGIIPGILFLDIFFRLFSMLLPTSGRMALNTDLIVSVLVAVAVCFFFFYVLPITHRAANYAKILILVSGIMFIMFVISAFMPPYSVKNQKRYVFTHEMYQSYKVDTNGNLALSQYINSSKTNSFDNIPCNYAVKNFKGIQNVSCDFYSCTYDTYFNISSPNVQLKKESNVYTINITYEESMRTSIYLEGPYQMIEINGKLSSNDTWAKYGIESSNWNFVVNANSSTNIYFRSYYLDWKHTPYLNETLSSMNYITLMGRPNFFTQTIKLSL